ncbi:winged helix-turn-helix transcriptional regulator [Sciscionella marina]|uniref:winged helix-turn-helix transcriptional regulator n=1 Tax=Sciscionella marina TaxID=508770 RepID=UPI00037C7F89|nr:helix-turn-helix domain-containing protein [Sciscionella marina]
MAVIRDKEAECPIDAALSVIGGRWKGTILWRLVDGPMRTGELRRSIPRITERMLIRHLKELVADGVLDRHDAQEVPPHVSYSISRYGRTLTPVLRELCSWGEAHMKRGPAEPGGCAPPPI